MRCRYEIPWYGMCKEETKGDNIYCEKHLKHTCVICGDQAVTQCGFASSLTCGAPLCDNTECHAKHIASHNKITSNDHRNPWELIEKMISAQNKQEIISRYNKKFKDEEIEFEFCINPKKEEEADE